MVKYSGTSKRRKILLSLAILLIIAAALFLFYINNNHPKKTESSDLDPLTGELINYDPATEEEIRAGEQSPTQQNFDSLEKDQNNKNKVYPIISTWTQDRNNKNLLLNGFVPSVVESDGICTLKLEKDGVEITQNKNARPDAQTTTCGAIEVDYESLKNGSWNAILNYSSSTSTGSSEAVRIDII